MIAVIDYGAGNLRSVANAIARLGYQYTVTTSPEDIVKAKAVILPGVGAAADTMDSLRKNGLVEAIRQVVSEDKPFLGVCLGLQVLFTGTEEGGWHDCLNIVPGKVQKLPPGQKIPHMGWNQVHFRFRHPIFEGIPDNSNFYFVHSYHVVPSDDSIICGETDYGITFCCAVARRNMVGVQFHPEKSGETGLKIYDNFCRQAGAQKC